MKDHDLGFAFCLIFLYVVSSITYTQTMKNIILYVSDNWKQLDWVE